MGRRDAGGVRRGILPFTRVRELQAHERRQGEATAHPKAGDPAVVSYYQDRPGTISGRDFFYLLFAVSSFVRMLYIPFGIVSGIANDLGTLAEPNP